MAALSRAPAPGKKRGRMSPDIRPLASPTCARPALFQFQSAPLTPATSGADRNTQEACQVPSAVGGMLGKCDGRHDRAVLAPGRSDAFSWETWAPTPGEERNRGDPYFPAGCRH